MKKISLLLFIVVLALYISCDKIYEEPTGEAFEGTWQLYDPSGEYGVTKFLTARQFEGENLLLFYDKGHYDSSFFFRTQNDKLFVRRVLDSVKIIEYYLIVEGDTVRNALGYPIIYQADLSNPDNSNATDRWEAIESYLKSIGRDYRIVDTLTEVKKPIYPQTGYSPEKYYGTYSFNKGSKLKLTINRYFTDQSGAPTDKLNKIDIYARPDEKE
jgi:hypothetical protein